MPYFALASEASWSLSSMVNKEVCFLVLARHWALITDDENLGLVWSVA